HQFVRYVPAEWRNFLPYYGPALLLGARTATNVFRSLPGVLLSFKVLAGACSLATLLLVAWLGRRLWPSRATFAVCLLALNPLVLFHVVGGAHIDAFIALAVVGAWALITGAEGRAPPVQAALELVATGLMASAAMVKPPIAMALLLF